VIKLTREGGHHRDRIAHAGGDATGAEISRALIAALHRVLDDPGIEVIEHALVVDLLTAADGAVCGVTLHVIGEGQVDGVGAAAGRAVVLATGGLGQIYASTTNPPVATGDGMAAALRAGARVTDLEFVQFHPTVLFLGEGSTGQQPLISEAVRGEGAFLVDGDGARIMAGRHPLEDLAPRDVVARAILDVMRDQGVDHVWLDARHLGGSFLEQRFPSIVARCRELGFDPAVDLLPVAPAQHYASGGVETDLLGRTSLDGLYACGECSCTGVHGANRLASNSLLEGLVFAHRIADDIAARFSSGDLPQRSVAAAAPWVGGGTPCSTPAAHRGAARHDAGLGAGALGRVDRRCAGRPRGARGPTDHGGRTRAAHLGDDQPAAPGTGALGRRAPARGDPRRARALGLPRARRRPLADPPHRDPAGRRPGRHHRTPRRRPPMSEHVFPLDDARLLVERALDEDLGDGTDVTTVATIPEEQESVSHLVARADGVVAGLPVVALVVEAVDARLGTGVVWVDLHVTDGDAVVRGDHLATLRGSTRTTLISERTILNVLSRTSGVATHTRRWADELAGSGAMVLDTRKTTPGIRALEKYAVRCGGGTNKRMGLYDVAMIKDNHKLAAGGLTAAYDSIRAAFPHVDIQVEVTTTAEALEAVAAGARFLLCDNMSTDLLRTTVDAVRATGEYVEVEATGGLTLEVAAEYAATGVDYLSVGALTHSSPILDIALDLDPDPS
jgi:nicotinate-nucleotide pyrophosphorylase (carboxylating)